MIVGHLIVSAFLVAAPVTESEASLVPAESASRRINVGVETLGGVMLFSSLNAYTFGVQPGWSFGACANVNFGQVLPVGRWGLELSTELRWQYSKFAQGTESFTVDAHHQAFTLSPSLALRFGARSPWLVFAEAGAGAEVVTVNAAAFAGSGHTGVVGRGLVQYGGGVRFAPVSGGAVGLTVRLEVMRVHRDAQGDTWLGVGAGVTF